MKTEANGLSGPIVGAYHLGHATGLIVGTAAGDTVWSIRFASAVYKMMVKRCRASLQIITPFTAAQEVALAFYVARGFTVSDTGGTAEDFSSNNQKLATQFSTSSIASTEARIATTGALTPGTRTLDTQPLVQASGAQLLAAASASSLPLIAEYENPSANRWPLRLAQNEGLVLRLPVALGVGGTVRIAIDFEWMEFLP